MIRVYTRIMDGDAVVVEHVVELPRDASPGAPANDQPKPTMVRESDAVADLLHRAVPQPSYRWREPIPESFPRFRPIQEDDGA